MLTKLCLASLLVVMALPQTSWGKSGCVVKDAVNGKETVSQELHPAGPTTRRERRSSQTEQPYRIQYERIRSGHVLVGQARLIYGKNGIWYVESSNKKRLNLLGRNESKTKTFKKFTEENQVWQVCVTRQEIPLIQQGVATESEPSLDLILFRL
jgi:hypothetical protein